ncbi:M23 family metallopeptidase [Halalkalibacillus halophilus]|uniref:M23 family metallopeptidase n=1 Tax=Halalkalibacillus halophilus TaxID=392827 RepID=UPI000422EFE7|nr:M23 family metallopeptidase [Halalkalibacillus halophilus]
MQNNLKEVRNRIKQRKQSKTSKNKPHVNTHSSFLTDEEKHGVMSDPAYEMDKLPSFKQSLKVKFVLSCCVFLLTFLLFQTPNETVQRSHGSVQTWLTEDLPFATIQSWYNARFDSFFFASAFNEQESLSSPDHLGVPVSSFQLENIQSANQGLLIEVKEEEDVYPLESGTVIFAGNKSDTGKTIIIQHEDGKKSIYGQLNEIDVFHYQFVQPNRSIATIKPDDQIGVHHLYLGMQQGTEYIDPLEQMVGEVDGN